MTNTKEENRSALRRVSMSAWKLVGGIVALAAAMHIWSALSGNAATGAPAPAKDATDWLIFAGVVVAALGHFAYRSRLFHRASHIESADALARTFFTEPLFTPQIYGADAGRACSASSVFAMYGDYDRALSVLAEIDWSNHSPMVQALEFHARAIVAYIRRDFSLGLQLSRRADALTEGANAGLRKLTSFAVDVGRALVEGDPDVVRQLEAHKPRPGTQLHTPFVYWVLSEVYAARGDLAISSIWLARCETRLPHARGLLNKAPDPSAGGTYAPNPNPYSTPASAPHLYTVHRRDRLQATLVVIIGWLAFILVCALWFARV